MDKANPDNAYDMNPPPAPPAPFNAQPDIRTTDRNCANCGYNLRGLPKQHLCPECGHDTPPYEIFRDELRYADGTWVRRLQIGAWTLLASMFACPLAIAITTLVHRHPDEIIGACARAIASVLTFLAIWLLSSREPNPIEFESRGSARRWLRWTALLTMSLFGAVHGWKIMSDAGLLQAGWIDHDSILLLWFAAATSALVRTTFLGVHLKELAFRIPDESLAARIWFATCTLTLSSFLLLVVSGIMLATDGEPDSLVCCALVLLVVFVCFYIWGTWLIARLALSLRAAA